MKTVNISLKVELITKLFEMQYEQVLKTFDVHASLRADTLTKKNNSILTI